MQVSKKHSVELKVQSLKRGMGRRRRVRGGALGEVPPYADPEKTELQINVGFVFVFGVCSSLLGLFTGETEASTLHAQSKKRSCH